MVHDDPEETAQPVEKRKRWKRKAFLAWVWVFSWAALIWTLGGDSFSFSETSRTMAPWIEWLIGDIDYRTRYQIYLSVRKFAHFSEYAILALLTFRAALLAARRTQLATAGWIALFIVTTLATADEARQTFSPVRTGSPHDVLIDVAGGLLAVLGVIVISRRLRTPAPAETSV